jgi:hypothetical protein
MFEYGLTQTTIGLKLVSNGCACSGVFHLLPPQVHSGYVSPSWF